MSSFYFWHWRICVLMRLNKGAFYNCRSLTSIVIPDSVTSIGSAAFYGCSGLTGVRISNRVTSISGETFWGCSSLTSVTLPDGASSIGYAVFCGCSELTSVIIGNNVLSVRSSAFQGCTKLKAVFYKGTAAQWNDISIDDDCLEKATRYYYSKNKPTESGNYWHYDTDGITPVIW